MDIQKFKEFTKEINDWINAHNQLICNACNLSSYDIDCWNYDGKEIEIDFSYYGGMCETDCEYRYLPIEWFESEEMLVDNLNKMIKKREEEKMKIEEERRLRQERFNAEKEKEEHELYLRLKEKYENQ